MTVEATVAAHRPPPPLNKRLPYRVDLYDGTGMMTLVFFHAYADSLKRLLPEGETRFVSGKIEWFMDEAQMAHPDHIAAARGIRAAAADRAGLSADRRPVGQGPGQGHPRGARELPELPEWQDQAFQQRQHWPGFSAALRAAASPGNACRHWDRSRMPAARGSPMTSCWPINWR